MAALVQKDWAIEINKKDENLRSKITIHKVPPYISGIKRSAHMPKMVSFGPNHHEDEALKPLEQHKTRALDHFLARAYRQTRRHTQFQEYLKALDDVAEELMDCYEELPERWQQNREEFLHLMLRDGCFMLEILYQKFDDYGQNDPIFSRHGMLHKMPHIRRDMLLIENQLPLLVLKTLVAVGRDKTEVMITFGCSAQQNEETQIEESLCRLILKFWYQRQEKLPNIQEGLHVLDVVRKSMIDTCGGEWKVQLPGSRCSSRSATALAEAGINFKTSKSSSLKDISFDRCQETLNLPPIIFDDATEFTFLNLMAFEQLHGGAGSDVTSYVLFMNNLIYTAKDVDLLRSEGIVINALGSDDAVAKLFNEISTDMTVDPSCSLNDIQTQLYLHCQNRWKRFKANLKHILRSPWVPISAGAASLLFFLSVAQTTFAILEYFKPNETISPRHT